MNKPLFSRCLHSFHFPCKNISAELNNHLFIKFDKTYKIEDYDYSFLGNLNKVKFELRNYVKKPFTFIEIKEIISNLAENTEKLIRSNKDFNYDLINSNLELSKFIYENQKLLQRPILFYKKYWICRPPEKALEILGVE